MIRQLKITNFKSHIDSTIQLGNLTVLTGVNGCGKTAIIQALLLLRQSFFNNRLAAGLDLNKPLCSIGLGQDALSRQAANGNISITLTLDNLTTRRFVFDAGNGLDDSFLKRDPSQDDYPRLDQLEEIPLFNKNFQYIGASRWGGVSNFPKDTYAVEVQRQLSLTNGQGELVAHFLNKYGIEDCFDYCNGKTPDKSLKSQTIYWERKISPNVTIDSQVSSNSSDSYIIRYGFEPSEAGGKSLEGLKAENIGFGISYSLPVIVALLSAPPKSLIIIENPEAHLHPAGQAELAKLITMVVSNGIQVIIETHSDHIITGIQLACKANISDQTKGVSRENVIINFLTPGKKHTADISEIEIEDNGILKDAPKGFFDQSEADFRTLYD